MVCSRPWFAETKQHIGPAQGWEKRGGEIKLKGEEPVGWLGTLSETVRTMTDVLVGERTDIGDLVLHSVEEVFLFFFFFFFFFSLSLPSFFFIFVFCFYFCFIFIFVLFLFDSFSFLIN